MSEWSFAGYDARWLSAALVPLFAGMYVAVSRQALSVFSRKALLDGVPEENRKALEAHLDHEEEYTASLRTVDLLLRLALVLSLAMGRWMVAIQIWPSFGFRVAAVVPEPGTAVIAAVVCFGLFAVRMRRQVREEELPKKFA